MALLTAQGLVATCQREAGLPIMIEVGKSPVAGVVTLLAIAAKAALVSVILLMAIDTLPWCAPEQLIAVAAFAGNGSVFAKQGERRELVIECGLLPARFTVAVFTLFAELALMWIGFLVTADAALFELGYRQGFAVALFTA